MKIMKLNSLRANVLQKTLVYIFTPLSIVGLYYLARLSIDLYHVVLGNTPEDVIINVAAYPIFVTSILSGIILLAIFYYGLRYYEDRFEWHEDWKSMVITIILVFMLLSAPYVFKNNKYEVTPEGIRKYSTIGALKQEYEWSDAYNIRISVQRTSPVSKSADFYEFCYELEFKNGKILDLYRHGYARDIWKGLEEITTIAKENNIPIIKDNSMLIILSDSPDYVKYREILAD